MRPAIQKRQRKKKTAKIRVALKKKYIFHFAENKKDPTNTEGLQVEHYQ